jgi:hypothetical protein
MRMSRRAQRSSGAPFNGRVVVQYVVSLACVATFGLTLVASNCGKEQPLPAPKVNCGKANWDANGTQSTVAGPGQGVQSDESIGSIGQAITDPRSPRATVATYPTTVNRNVVLVNFYNAGRLVAYETGVVVGAHAVLTAAHQWIPTGSTTPAYDEVRIAVRTPLGTYVETPVLQTFVDPAFVTDWQQHGEDGADLRGDLLLAMVPIDFTYRTLNITPLHIDTNYIPPRDCNECPDQILSFTGFGLTADELQNSYLNNPRNFPMRGVTAEPLNSTQNIEQNGMMTFPPVAQPGDSGSPVTRFANGRDEVVGLVLGQTDANSNYEIDPRGNNAVTMVNTIDADRLQVLQDQAAAWRGRQIWNTYPQNESNYPNGAPNRTQNPVPTTLAGAPAATAGSMYTGLDGYYVGYWILVSLIAIQQPGPARGCR